MNTNDTEVKNSNSKFKRKRYVIPVIIIALLIALRLALPSIVKNYVNNVLDDIPGYSGYIDDIDINLFRGAYVIHKLNLNTVDGESEVPLLSFDRADISVQWTALFDGKIVSEIILNRPELIYVFEYQTADSTETEVNDWSKALTDLVPIEINTLRIKDGKVAFVELTADPTIDLNMSNLHLTATNLRNVVDVSEKLPSEVHATATSVGNGNFKLNGSMNLVKQIPDMDISFSLENASATALNDFTNHYAGIDFAEGNFNVFSEIAIADSFLTGYLKPILKDSKLIEKEDKYFEKIWEGFVGFFKFILKNQKENTLATEIPIEGDLTAVEGEFLPTFLNIFKNAWIKAYQGTIEGKVDFEDAKKTEE
ncbi:MAG: DUF748 domain-containing protein [Pricia sp.]